MNEVRYNASWMRIDWQDLEAQIIAKVKAMRLQWIDMTRDKLCQRADITYSAILRAIRCNSMRVKTINKLKRIGVAVKILG